MITKVKCGTCCDTGLAYYADNTGEDFVKDYCFCAKGAELEASTKTLVW